MVYRNDYYMFSKTLYYLVQYLRNKHKQIDFMDVKVYNSSDFC